MNCEEAKRLLDDLLDGDLDEAGERAVRLHVADCDDCAARCEDLLAIEKWARTLEPCSPSADFTRNVMTRVTFEQPVYETSTSGLAIVAAAVLAASIVPFLLETSETVYGTVGNVVGAVVQYAQSFAADVSEASSQAMTGLAALWAAFEKMETPLSPLGMALTAAGAFLLMVVFNLIQARVLAQRT